MVAEEKLPEVLFQPYQPRERLSESLSVADVHLVSLDPKFEGLVYPSKVYGIRAAGRPIVCLRPGMGVEELRKGATTESETCEPSDFARACVYWRKHFACGVTAVSAEAPVKA